MTQANVQDKRGVGQHCVAHDALLALRAWVNVTDIRKRLSGFIYNRMIQ
jgi:hypothetical protein